MNLTNRCVQTISSSMTSMTYTIHHFCGLPCEFILEKIPRYQYRRYRYPLDQRHSWQKGVSKLGHILFTSHRPDATAWSRVGKTRQGCPPVHLDEVPMFLLFPGSLTNQTIRMVFRMIQIKGFPFLPIGKVWFLDFMGY